MKPVPILMIVAGIALPSFAGEISVSEPVNIIRHANGPGPADDTITFDVVLSGENAGAGWSVVSDKILPMQVSPMNGAYGPVTFTVSTGPQNIRFPVQDEADPELTAYVGITNAPGPYHMGDYDTGDGKVPLYTDPLQAPNPRWEFRGGADRSVELVYGSGSALEAFQSDIIQLSGSGEFQFYAILSTGYIGEAGFSGVESFRVELIRNGDTEHPLLPAKNYDVNGNGRLEGAELCPPPVSGQQAPVHYLERILRTSIPEGTTSLQVIVSGSCNSVVQSMKISRLLISPAAIDTDGDGMSNDYEDAHGLDKNSASDRTEDLDGDGQSNYDEFLAGTHANDPNSVFLVSNIELNAELFEIKLTWSSVPGRAYLLQTSTDLTTWRDGELEGFAPLYFASPTEASTTRRVWKAPGELRYYRIKLAP